MAGTVCDFGIIENAGATPPHLDVVSVLGLLTRGAWFFAVLRVWVAQLVFVLFSEVFLTFGLLSLRVILVCLWSILETVLASGHRLSLDFVLFWGAGGHSGILRTPSGIQGQKRTKARSGWAKARSGWSQS